MKKQLLMFIFIAFNFASNAQNLVWAKQVTGPATEEPKALAIDAAGNTYTTGWFTGTVDFDPSAISFNLTAGTNGDIFILKLDPAGSFQWAVSFGSTGVDMGFSIAVDGSGNVYTVGSYTGTVDFEPGSGTTSLSAVGNQDMFISKLDASGNFVWAKSVGGSGFDAPTAVAVDVSGNLFVTGSFHATVDMDPGSATTNFTSSGQADHFVLKLDASGNYGWAKIVGGTGDDGAWDLTLDNAGNVYTTGYFEGTVDFDPGGATENLTAPGGFTEIFVMKMDASGNYVWARNMGGNNPGGDHGRAVEVDASGNVYTTGYFTATGDFDPGGGTAPLTSPGATGIFISKLNSSGNFVWAKGVGGNTGSNIGMSMAIDASANIYIAGYFNGTSDFDPGAGVVNLVADAGGFDVFMLKLNSSGDFGWAANLGGTYNDLASGIVLGPSGNVLITGYFNNTVDFDPGTPVVNLVASGQDGFVARFDNITGVEDIDSENALAIYPNPASRWITFRSEEQLASSSYSIADQTGRIVLRGPLANGGASVDITSLASGCYIVRVGNGYRKKLMVVKD